MRALLLTLALAGCGAGGLPGGGDGGAGDMARGGDLSGARVCDPAPPACNNGVVCGGGCCAAGEWCDGAACHCGSGPACTNGTVCATGGPIGPDQSRCGTICCGGPGMPCPL